MHRDMDEHKKKQRPRKRLQLPPVGLHDIYFNVTHCVIRDDAHHFPNRKSIPHSESISRDGRRYRGNLYIYQSATVFV